MYGELTLVAALLAGLLGSTHCLGMCGGIAGALSLGTPAARRGPVQGAFYGLLFNGGRVLSYALAGLIAGGFGLALGNALNFSGWSGLLRVLTGLIVLAVGVQLAFDWRGLRHIEAIGGRLWRRLGPITGRLLPVRSPGAALALGLMWGWLPCGLVYTMLLAAATSGTPLQGAAVMAAFGLGTMPAMIGVVLAAARLGGLSAMPALKRAGGALMLLFGAWIIAGPSLLHHPITHALLDCLPGT